MLTKNTGTANLPSPGLQIRQALLIAILVVIGISARLLFLAQWAGNPLYHVPTGDELNFHNTALAMIGHTGADADFLYQPLGSFYLSLLYRLFGVNLPAVKTFQLLIGVATILIFYGLAKELVAGEEARKKSFVAGATALLAGLYGPQIFFEGQLLAPVLCVPLTAAGLWCLLAASRKSSLWLIAIGGALLGLAIMGRPNLAVILPVVAGWFMFRPWDWIRKTKALVVLGVFILVGVAPALIRNVLYGHGPVLVSASAGHSFYIGNNPQATGIFHVPKGEKIDADSNHQAYRQSWKQLAEQALRRELSPSEVSTFWLKQGLNFWIEQPGKAIELTGKKFFFAINSYECPVHHPYILGKEVAPVLRYLLTFGILFPFSILGIWLSLRRRPQARLLFGCGLTYLGSLVVFYVADRYRILLVPMLAPLAGLGVYEMYNRFRNTAWPRWLTLLAVFILSFAATQLPISPKTADQQSLAISYNVMGKVEGDRRNLAQAEKYFRKAIELAGPQQGSTPRSNLAIILERRGDMYEAEKLYREAARIDPDSRFARIRLAMMSERTGRYSTALRWWKQVEAISADPTEARGHINRLGELLDQENSSNHESPSDSK